MGEYKNAVCQWILDIPPGKDTFRTAGLKILELIAGLCHKEIDEFGSLGHAMIGWDEIARHTRMGRGAVERNLDKLGRLGALVIVERGGRNPRRSHVYAIPGRRGCLDHYKYMSLREYQVQQAEQGGEAGAGPYPPSTPHPISPPISHLQLPSPLPTNPSPVLHSNPPPQIHHANTPNNPGVSLYYSIPSPRPVADGGKCHIPAGNPEYCFSTPGFGSAGAFCPSALANDRVQNTPETRAISEHIQQMKMELENTTLGDEDVDIDEDLDRELDEDRDEDVVDEVDEDADLDEDLDRDLDRYVDGSVV